MEGKEKNIINLRYNIMIIIIFIIGFILLIQLCNLQIKHGDEYRAQSGARLTRETIVHADRGEILDRNGVKLVTTSTGYSLDLYKTTNDDEAINNNILNIANVLEKNGDKYNDNLILKVNPFSFGDESEESIKRWKKNNNLDENLSAEQCFYKLKEKYNIKQDDVKQARTIMTIRNEIKTKRI